ncbi:hypothetical protein [Endozoicomonas sp. 4G]|uniref:hypothetical protein n=1 Tax=Endozoicomonas sp. 4G TaxID=2872754 RepID=UPI0020791B6C|nr:hypothetical protein [Endozoicomonas sp. 4G]
MRVSLWQTLLFFTFVTTGTVKGDFRPTPSPLSIVLGDGSIIVEEDTILSIQGFTPFFDSQKGSVLLISDINKKNRIRLRADARQSLIVTDISGDQKRIDLQSLVENKKAVFLPVDSSIHTEKTGQSFSGNLTPGRAIFSLSGLGIQGKSLLPAHYGLLGINDNKALLSDFLDYPVTPTFVEVTAYMNYENYPDNEDVSDTMMMLRFMVEKSLTVATLYSLLRSAFPEIALGIDEFKKKFCRKEQPLKLKRLYNYLVSKKQSAIDKASQTADGATEGASAALPESESAVTAVGYLIAKQIRREYPRNRDDKINAVLERFPEPAAVAPVKKSSASQQGVPVWRGGANTVSAGFDSPGGNLMLTGRGAEMVPRDELPGLLRAVQRATGVDMELSDEEDEGVTEGEGVAEGEGGDQDENQEAEQE